MSFGQFAAATLQTLLIILFTMILTPLRYSLKKSITVISCTLIILSIATGCLEIALGTSLMLQFGFLIIGVPLFLVFFILSKVKGIRFLFIMLTTFIFHQILCSLLIAFRVWAGGFTFAYFLLNIFAFGILLVGGYVLRTDFHKIIGTYRYEFICLSSIVLLLYLMLHIFTPVIENNLIDNDLLLITLVLDLLVVLLYLYMGVSFHSLGKRCNETRDSLSIELQLEGTQNYIAQLRSSQEKVACYRHDLRHHISLIRVFLDSGETDQLRKYLDEVQRDLERDQPTYYCQNETANLLIASFTSIAEKFGIQLLTDAQLPQILPIGNTELCTLLSNALENAIHATQNIVDSIKKVVTLTAKLHEGKLLIMVQNPYFGEILLENGRPQSSREGHGFGVKSIESIVDSHSGLSSYEAKEGVFTLRIVI